MFTSVFFNVGKRYVTEGARSTLKMASYFEKLVSKCEKYFGKQH